MQKGNLSALKGLGHRVGIDDLSKVGKFPIYKNYTR